MAEVFQTSVPAEPATPIKGGVTAQSSEVPRYSPGAVPPYAASKDIKTSQNDPLFDELSTAYTPSQPQLNSLTAAANRFHPVLPNGDLYYDIKNHVKCYPIYNNNVDTLLDQFLTMKRELDRVRTALAKSEWETQTERDARLSAESQLRTAEQQLKETQDDLSDARAEIVEKEAQLLEKERQLARAISQISDLVSRLEITKRELRDMTRIKEQLENELRSAVRERDFYKERCLNLEEALRIANAGEDAANDRNTRLTKMLFEIEASKAQIERAKDAAENKVRFLEQRWRDGPGKIISDLENKISELESEVERLESQTKGLMTELAHRDEQIAELKEEIERVKEELENVRSELNETQEARNELQNTVNEHNAIIEKLPNKCRKNCKCKAKFFPMGTMSNMAAFEDSDASDDEPATVVPETQKET